MPEARPVQPIFQPAHKRLAVLAPIVIGMLVALRVLYAWTYRIDSDEPQHLHVVWGWANGLLPYRDLADNHAPLFQFLCAPLFRIFGERPDIIIPMRIAVIPLFLLTLWCVYKIGDALFSRRTGCWAACLAALFPPYFTTSTEFRTDDLWAALWTVVLLILITGRPSWKRAMLAGSVLGAAVATSMKSTLLLGSLAVALGFAIHLRRVPPRRWLSWMICGLGGLALIPGIAVCFFASRHALQPLIYGVFQHNLVPGYASRFASPWANFSFLWRAAGLLWGARIIFRRTPEPRLGIRRAVIFLSVGIYFCALRRYWPVITREDYLPVFPLMFLLLIPLLDRLRDAISTLRPGLPRATFPALLAAGEMLWLLAANPPWINRTATPIRNLARILHLADPGDFVMDAKGETIFRRRSYFYVLETVTHRRINLGLIPNDVVEKLITTRTCVVRARRLPRSADTFVRDNYLPLFDLVRVAGGELRTPGQSEFTVVIPARYVFVSQSGVTAGVMDGVSCDGPVFLDAGRHVFERTLGSGRLVFVWAQCVERGFSPFARPDPRDDLERRLGKRDHIL